MGRKQKQQAELRPVYTQPTLDHVAQMADRAWRAARYCGPRHKPAAGTFDPLWLRAGMRANCIRQRAGWVVSNPWYDRVLREHPDLDESLGGREWLRQVYLRERALVALPGVRAVVDERMRRHEQADCATARLAQDTQAPQHDLPAQGELFAERT